MHSISFFPEKEIATLQNNPIIEKEATGNKRIVIDDENNNFSEYPYNPSNFGVVRGGEQNAYDGENPVDREEDLEGGGENVEDEGNQESEVIDETVDSEEDITNLSISSNSTLND